MFVLLMKYLVCGMMLAHSLLGCHAHHVADACCSVAFSRVQQLFVTSDATTAALRPAAGCACGHAHIAEETADEKSDRNADSPSAPVQTCCAEHECVYLPDTSAPELIVLTGWIGEHIVCAELLESGSTTNSLRPDRETEVIFPSARLRAQMQVWRI